MGIDVLLEYVQQTEEWWRARNHHAGLKDTQVLTDAIRSTRRKFFPDDAKPGEIIEALIVADGLREAARQCVEGQGALSARLNGGAETIERLCRSREVPPETKGLSAETQSRSKNCEVDPIDMRHCGSINSGKTFGQ